MRLTSISGQISYSLPKETPSFNTLHSSSALLSQSEFFSPSKHFRAEEVSKRKRYSSSMSPGMKSPGDILLSCDEGEAVPPSPGGFFKNSAKERGEVREARVSVSRRAWGRGKRARAGKGRRLRPTGRPRQFPEEVFSFKDGATAEVPAYLVCRRKRGRLSPSRFFFNPFFEEELPAHTFHIH